MLNKFIDLGWIKSLDESVRIYDPSFIVKNPFNHNNITFRYDVFGF